MRILSHTLAQYLWALAHISSLNPTAQVRLVPAKEAPRRGKGGTLASRQAMLHALANIENWAVDLAWDIIARFGAADAAGAGYQLPRDFYTDFVAVSGWLVGQSCGLALAGVAAGVVCAGAGCASAAAPADFG
jgi:hypothetical protein